MNTAQTLCIETRFTCSDKNVRFLSELPEQFICCE